MDGVQDGVISPQAQQQAATFLAEVEARSSKHYTPSGLGRMVWRNWPGPQVQRTGPPVILLHGGGGAWSHWVRNIGPLAQHHSVWAPDLPGLGDSDLPAELSMEGISDTLAQGLSELVPGDAPINLVGFSFGTSVACCLATRLGGRIRHLVLAGTRFVFDEALVYPQLVNWKDCKDPAERLAAHRRNLQIMMIADPDRVDALATYIQATNVPKAKFFGLKLDPTGKVEQYLPQVRPSISLSGVCGRADQFSQSLMHRQEDGLRAIHPAARFHGIDGAGHWVQYEAAQAFNAILLDTLLQQPT